MTTKHIMSTLVLCLGLSACWTDPVEPNLSEPVVCPLISMVPNVYLPDTLSMSPLSTLFPSLPVVQPLGDERYIGLSLEEQAPSSTIARNVVYGEAVLDIEHIRMQQQDSPSAPLLEYQTFAPDTQVRQSMVSLTPRQAQQTCPHLYWQFHDFLKWHFPLKFELRYHEWKQKNVRLRYSSLLRMGMQTKTFVRMLYTGSNEDYLKTFKPWVLCSYDLGSSLTQYQCMGLSSRVYKELGGRSSDFFAPATEAQDRDWERYALGQAVGVSVGGASTINHRQAVMWGPPREQEYKVWLQGYRQQPDMLSPSVEEYRTESFILEDNLRKHFELLRRGEGHPRRFTAPQLELVRCLLLEKDEYLFGEEAVVEGPLYDIRLLIRTRYGDSILIGGVWSDYYSRAEELKANAELPTFRRRAEELKQKMTHIFGQAISINTSDVYRDDDRNLTQLYCNLSQDARVEKLYDKRVGRLFLIFETNIGRRMRRSALSMYLGDGDAVLDAYGLRAFVERLPTSTRSLGELSSEKLSVVAL